MRIYDRNDAFGYALSHLKSVAAISDNTADVFYSPVLVEPFGSVRRKLSIQFQRRRFRGENEQWTRPKTKLNPVSFGAQTPNLALSQLFASLARLTVMTRPDLQICLTRKKENPVCSHTQ